MAKQSSKAKKIAKRERPSNKQEKQILENNVACGNSKKAAQSHRPKRLKRAVSEKSSLLERAEELADQMPVKCPHFVKEMLPSHVAGGFWLGLPSTFCHKHIGTSDQRIILEDETGDKFKTTYLGHKMGLSAGWRGFSIHHHLLEGDVLVFQKVRAHEFKVYIVKPNGSKKLKFPGDHAEDSQMASVTTCSIPTTCDLSEDILYIDNYVGGTESEEDMFNYIDNYEAGAESEDDIDPEIFKGAGLSESSVTCFKEVTCIEKFKIIFNGCNINSQVPKLVLKKYYELCRGQNSYLHENLVESLNSQLVAGLISETVNIADAIKFCKITTEESEFSKWDKTLQASEMLGMNVGFMRSRASKLASLAAESKTYKDARLAREQEEAEFRVRLADFLKEKDKADREGSEKSVQVAASFKQVLTNVPR
ncbi:B3 domain-containing protein Os01g0234100-like [Rosa rugosa]|uniref:B3 domain-containing protein Os01g0234100-like n=1 Tax=Rosa rugosa TaxID=74645 RepID=UPI002B402537|nr:B3 domain-containing protein Os01g0234100-like [Rosa rugosa]